MTWRNPEKAREYARRYAAAQREAHPEEARARARTYYQAHPEKQREANQRYAQKRKLLPIAALLGVPEEDLPVFLDVAADPDLDLEPLLLEARGDLAA